MVINAQKNNGPLIPSYTYSPWPVCLRKTNINLFVSCLKSFNLNFFINNFISTSWRHCSSYTNLLENVQDRYWDPEPVQDSSYWQEFTWNQVSFVLNFTKSTSDLVSKWQNDFIQSNSKALGFIINKAAIPHYWYHLQCNGYFAEAISKG